MKLNNQIVDEVISEVAGEDVLPLVRALKNKKNVSEFKLAEDIDREINEVRNMLYRLYNANLVSFIRKKDKKKGWYIYYWTFNAKRISYLTMDLKKRKFKKLVDRIEVEKNSDFYLCSANQCIRLDFSQAIDFNFKCPECGALMNQEDSEEKIKDLEREAKELQRDIKASS